MEISGQKVYVVVSRDGANYTNAYSTRESFLASYSDYLEDTPEMRPHFEDALDAAEQGMVGDLGDGDQVLHLTIDPAAA